MLLAWLPKPIVDCYGVLSHGWWRWFLRSLKYGSSERFKTSSNPTSFLDNSKVPWASWPHKECTPEFGWRVWNGSWKIKRLGRCWHWVLGLSWSRSLGVVNKNPYWVPNIPRFVGNSHWAGTRRNPRRTSETTYLGYTLAEGLVRRKLGGFPWFSRSVQKINILSRLAVDSCGIFHMFPYVSRVVAPLSAWHGQNLGTVLVAVGDGLVIPKMKELGSPRHRLGGWKVMKSADDFKDTD